MASRTSWDKALLRRARQPDVRKQVESKLSIIRRTGVLPAVFLLAVLVIAVNAQETPGGNLALTARATASSASEDTKPENLTDGDITHTQWNAKEGTSPADTWVELNWPSTVQFQEVVIRQDGDPKLSHFNLETRDASGRWRLLQTVGDSQHLLPRLILAQFAAQRTSGLRLSSFAGGVSLNEVEVYNRTDPPAIEVASDLLNHIFGIVTDGFGTQPFANAAVQLQSTAGAKPWHATARTDANGMFQVEMPVGLAGDVTATVQLPNGTSPKRTVEAGDLTPGLSLPDDTAPMLNLNGVWRFKLDPEPDFFSQPSPILTGKTSRFPPTGEWRALTTTLELAAIVGTWKFR